MSILQEYENHCKYISKDKMKAIQVYIDNLKEVNANIYYSDIVYKKTEWKKFEDWYKKVYNIKHGKSAK